MARSGPAEIISYLSAFGCKADIMGTLWNDATSPEDSEPTSSAFGDTLGDDALDPADHHVHHRFVRQLLTAERSPREKIDRVPECSGEKLSSLIAKRADYE
jgi:hypothetical protein